jgi:PAS domain S-box-containing protein
MTKIPNAKTGRYQKHDRSRKRGKIKIARTKEFIKESLEKHSGSAHENTGSDIALEVVEKKIEEDQPVRQALAAEHLFRKSIEDSIPLGVAGFDDSGKQIYANPMFCEMVQWQKTELIDMPFPQPYWAYKNIEGRNNKKISVFNRIILSKNFETQLKRRSGEQFWALVFVNILSDSAGTSIGRLISIADISRQKNAENKLRILSTKLMDAREKERKHIAQDLHDSIGGKLTGLKYSLETIASELPHGLSSIEGKLMETVGGVRSTIEEVQRITKNLHPSILDDLGLISAVREYCREFQHFYPSIKVHLKFDIDEQRVEESIKILIYRVLQEAMNNVAKHSEAENVMVSMNNSTNENVLMIKDDGKGFEPKCAVDSSISFEKFGLESMRERAELFGGRFILHSAKGNGTKITASWLLKD